jgi:hypothetical protein
MKKRQKHSGKLVEMHQQIADPKMLVAEYKQRKIERDELRVTERAQRLIAEVYIRFYAG